jgi:uncharacterized protein YdcH (DUF465 family)
MSHTPHELASDFPDLADRIHELKVSNARFAQLLEDYHRINRDVHRAETGVQPISDTAETGLRKERANLKDTLYAMLTA